MKTIRVVFVLGLIGLVAGPAVACGEARNGGPRVTHTFTPRVPTPTAEADTITIALAEQNDSGQRGSATLTASGNKTQVTLNITAGGLETELVHIHDGPCNDLGGVVHGLESFVDGSGGSSTLVDASLASLRSGNLAINSHQAGNPGTYTTCGDIPAE